jgi:hypothetical protein
VSRRNLIPLAVAALGAAIYLVVAPPSADLAAQEFRADLGLVLWNNGWYAGHHTPGYSLLFPPLGGALGVRVVGALAAIAAAALFTALARRHWSDEHGATAAALWFAAGTTAVLLTGRLTFLLGVAIGVGALLALAYDRRLTAVALAALTTLAGPVAGLFVALGVVAWALADRRERGLTGAAVVTAALAPTVVTLVLFAQGGSEPFVASAFWPALAGALLVAALLPTAERTLRIAALLYAVALLTAFVIQTPLGGNASRLGALAAGPVVLGALAGRRGTLALVALALPLAYWPLYPAVRDVVRASGDPSLRAGYHAPLIDYLRSRPGQGAFRVEIPFTENHWEARHVAGGRDPIAIARGWERQLDRRYGELFYDGSLDAASYRAWLDERAVAYVAVPDVALDYAGRDEAALIDAGLPYLREVWRNEHWRVYAVSRPAPLAAGAGAGAGATLDDKDTFTVRARRAGDVIVRVHHTRWWRVTGGRACVSAAPGEQTRVRIFRPGTVRIQARLTGSSCRR